MATPLSTIRTDVRNALVAPSSTDTFWTDDELLRLLILGCQDLWKAYVDLRQDHFLTIDETNVSLLSGATSLSGVPADVFRVKGIEPRTLNESTATIFIPKDFTHPDFVRARQQSASDATGRVIYYDVIASGAPVAAPTIRTAPAITSDLLARLIYIRTLGALTADSDNPIPGDSDNALKAWGVAYARQKEREDRAPDPEWIAIYSSEKQQLITVNTPRQDDEPDYAEALFETDW